MAVIHVIRRSPRAVFSKPDRCWGNIQPCYYRIVKHFSDETLIQTVNRGLQSPTSIKSNLLWKTQLSQILRFVFSILTAFAAKINFGFSVFATVTSIWGNSYVPTNVCRTPENRYVQEPFSLKSDINNHNRDNKHSIFSGTVSLTYFSQLRPWVAVNLVNGNPFFQSQPRKNFLFRNTIRLKWTRTLQRAHAS